MGPPRAPARLPDFIPVTSSWIAAVRWVDADLYRLADDFLDVKLQSGRVYRVYGVTLKVWDDLFGAASYGKFFNRILKQGGYTIKRVA